MATDNSPPRTQLIGVIAAGTVLTLVALKFLFDSYFQDIMESEAKAEDKVSQYEEVRTMRAQENAALSGPFHGPLSPQNKTRNSLPIAEAMRQFASTPRMALGAIHPQASMDEGPLTGWAKGIRADKGAQTLASPQTANPLTDGGADAATTGPAGAATMPAADGGLDAGRTLPSVSSTPTNGPPGHPPPAGAYPGR